MQIKKSLKRAIYREVKRLMAEGYDIGRIQDGLEEVVSFEVAGALLFPEMQAEEPGLTEESLRE